MLERIFPRQIDNTYRGRRAGLWLFILLVAIKLIMSANSILNTRAIATGPDGIPLDSYGAAGAETVIRLFSFVALGQLVLALLGVVALIRYRAMIPLLYLLLIAEAVARRGIGLLHPIDGPEASPVGLYINLTLLAVLLVGFGLSLLNRPPRGDRGEPS